MKASAYKWYIKTGWLSHPVSIYFFPPQQPLQLLAFSLLEQESVPQLHPPLPEMLSQTFRPT